MNQADLLARLSSGDDQLAEAAVREFTSRPSMRVINGGKRPKKN